MAAGKLVLFLTNHGQLVVIDSDAATFEPIASYQVSDTQTWAHPVIVGNRILIKDHLTLRSLGIDSGERREAHER